MHDQGASGRDLILPERFGELRLVEPGTWTTNERAQNVELGSCEWHGTAVDGDFDGGHVHLDRPEDDHITCSDLYPPLHVPQQGRRAEAELVVVARERQYVVGAASERGDALPCLPVGRSRRDAVLRIGLDEQQSRHPIIRPIASRAHSGNEERAPEYLECCEVREGRSDDHQIEMAVLQYLQGIQSREGRFEPASVFGEEIGGSSDELRLPSRNEHAPFPRSGRCVPHSARRGNAAARTTLMTASRAYCTRSALVRATDEREQSVALDSAAEQ